MKVFFTINFQQMKSVSRRWICLSLSLSLVLFKVKDERENVKNNVLLNQQLLSEEDIKCVFYICV